MLHSDARFIEAVTSTVAELERETAAEIVVVSAARSARYTHAAIFMGAAIAWLAVAGSVLAGRTLSAEWLLIELPIVGLLVFWWVQRSPAILRHLLSQHRKNVTVKRAAAAAFTEELVHGTRERTGLLVYVSGLEQKVFLVPDGGIEAVVPPREWDTLPWCHREGGQAPRELDAFLDGLRQVGACLARHLPAKDNDNPDELCNAPRVRP